MQLVKLDSLLVDVKAQNEGQWQKLSWPGVRVRVRSIEYEAYKMARDAERERLAMQYVNAPVPDRVWHPILARLLVEHILLEWDGLDALFDPDFAVKILGSEEGRVLRSEIVGAAGRVGLRELAFAVQLEKNSAASSDTN
jgi:hypothetical protein